MRNFLLMQSVIFFPPLTFFLIAVLVFLLLPKEEETDNVFLDVSASGIELIQRRTDGGKLIMQTEKLRRDPEGELAIDNIRLRTQSKTGEINFYGNNAVMDANQEYLTLPHAKGVLTGQAHAATLILQAMEYRLADGRLSGVSAQFTDKNKQVSSDRLTLTADGMVIADGNVHARFSSQH